MNFVKIILSIVAITSLQAQNSKMNLLIGTYTKSCDSKGIYVYEFDTITGDFSPKNSSQNTVNPSYLALSPDNKKVYAVNENENESFVSTFDFDKKNGSLNFINKTTTGFDPCYIINDETNAIVANYSSGTISVFRKNNRGDLTPSKQTLHFRGKGADIIRQKSPHIHFVIFSPDKKYVLATDLGKDKIYIFDYQSNAANEILKIKDSISVKAGSGPRHISFDKAAKNIYVIQEMSGDITTFSYKNGLLKQISETTLLSENFRGDIGAADIHISPDGKFLYATNRGDANDISIFQIEKNGRLKFIEKTSTLGKGPRNFVIDPTGNYLLVANQYSNDIVIFKINKETGKIEDTKKRIKLCSPVCLIFSPII